MKGGIVREVSRKTNAEWSAETRAALLVAARGAFETEGYDRASIESIAAAARVTKGAIYHHYKNKKELFQAVFEEAERELVRNIDRVALAQPSPYEGIVQGCEAFLDAVLEAGMARVVLLDGPRVLGWKTWRRIDAETGGQSLRAGLVAAMTAEQIVPLDPDVLTVLISGALNEAALLCHEVPDRRKRRKMVSLTLKRLFQGLQPMREF